MCNIAWNVASNVELHLFFAKWIPGAVIPERRSLSHTTLPRLAQDAIDETAKLTNGKMATGQCDGWKNCAKTHVVASMMTVDNEVRYGRHFRPRLDN